MSGTRAPSRPGTRCSPPTWRPTRIAIEAAVRLPRKDVPIVLYEDDGEGLVAQGQRSACGAWLQQRSRTRRWPPRPGAMPATKFSRTSIPTQRPLASWSSSRRHTPSLERGEVADADRRQGRHRHPRCPPFRRIATMNIPGSLSVPGAELVLRAGRAAPDPDTTIIVNCAGHSIDHRHPIADQCRPAQQCGRRATAPSAGGWRGTDSSTVRIVAATSACSKGRMTAAMSPIAPASAVPQAKPLRLPPRTRARSIASTCARRTIHGRPSRRLPSLSRWPAGAGDRHGCARARRARPPPDDKSVAPT